MTREIHICAHVWPCRGVKFYQARPKEMERYFFVNQPCIAKADCAIAEEHGSGEYFFLCNSCHLMGNLKVA